MDKREEKKPDTRRVMIGRRENSSIPKSLEELKQVSLIPIIKLDDEVVPPKKPPLTDKMLHKIENSLSRPSDEILVQKFHLNISVSDLETLNNRKWLNNEIVHFYMNLITERSKGNNNFPKVLAMDTYFYTRLTMDGHWGVRRWTKKLDIFSYELIIIPIHLGSHWCVSGIDFRNKSIKYYDSLGSPNATCLKILKNYIAEESVDKKKIVYNTKDWKLESMKNVPQQDNRSDCGIFSCAYAEYLSADREFAFGQADVPYFRKKIAYEILTSELLTFC